MTRLGQMSAFDLPVLQAWQVDVLKIKYDRRLTRLTSTWLGPFRPVVSRTVCVDHRRSAAWSTSILITRAALWAWEILDASELLRGSASWTIFARPCR
jgi:hypothetical protein